MTRCILPRPEARDAALQKSEEFDQAVTRNYSKAVKRKTTKSTRAEPQPMMLREIAVAPGIGEIINVRSPETDTLAPTRCGTRSAKSCARFV